MASSNMDQAGLPDENGRVQAIIYEASFEGDTIKATGVFTQRDPKVLFSAIAASDNTTHEFKVDDSTVYQQFESDGPVPITKEECANYLDTLLDCGGCFEVEMENGVVKAVSFYS